MGKTHKDTITATPYDKVLRTIPEIFDRMTRERKTYCGKADALRGFLKSLDGVLPEDQMVVVAMCWLTHDFFMRGLQELRQSWATGRGE